MVKLDFLNTIAYVWSINKNNLIENKLSYNWEILMEMINSCIM